MATIALVGAILPDDSPTTATACGYGRTVQPLPIIVLVRLSTRSGVTATDR